jgi:hypothetical protein
LQIAVRSLQIQGQQALQDLVVGEGVGPAVGVEDGRVQGYVNVIQFKDFDPRDGVAGDFGELGGVGSFFRLIL